MNFNMFSVLRDSPTKNHARLATSKPYITETDRLDGTTRLIFDIGLAEMINDALFYDNAEKGSIEQERFIKRFCKEAGDYTDYLNGKNTEDTRSWEVKQLDDWLASKKDTIDVITVVPKKPEEITNSFIVTTEDDVDVATTNDINNLFK